MAGNSLDYHSPRTPPPRPLFFDCPYRRAERSRQMWSWIISIGVTLAAVAIIGVAIFLAVSYDKDDPTSPRNNQPIKRE